MATRRRGRGAMIAEALGEGMSNVSTMIMRSMMQDRIDQRQHTNNLAVVDRQGKNSETQMLNALLSGLAENKVDPDQVAAFFLQTGREVPANLSAMQPSQRRRLESSVGKSIMDAKAPEDVPGDLDIASIARTLGIGEAFPGMPPDATAGMLPASGPFADLDPMVSEFGQRATERRNTLMRKPTQVLTGETDEGAPTAQGVSLYDLTTPKVTGPGAYRQGVNEGITEVAKINTAGASMAEQKGAEAGATTAASEGAKLAPELVDARVNEAARTAAARARAEMPVTLQIARERAQIEANASADAEHIKTTAAAARATANLEPFIKRFGELIDTVNTQEGMTARAVGSARQLMSWLGRDTEVAELDQLVNQNLRGVAQAMGVREAQVSDKDQEIVRNGLGISALSSRTEAINAYRNLIDMTTIAPIVAARTRADTPMVDRMKLAKDLIQSRRDAEAATLAAADAAGKRGTVYYQDPVTGATMRLMR